MRQHTSACVSIRLHTSAYAAKAMAAFAAPHLQRPVPPRHAISRSSKVIYYSNSHTPKASDVFFVSGKSDVFLKKTVVFSPLLILLGQV
jgi:hypothetical protein